MMKKNSWIAYLLIVITVVAASHHTIWARSTFKFPGEIKYDFWEKGSLISVCTYKYKKAAKGKVFSSLILECTRPISLHDADNFHTTISNKDFSVLFALAGRGTEGIFDIKVSGIKGEKKFSIEYTEGKNLDKHTKKISYKYEVIDFISTFFVASQRVVKGDFKKSKKFQLLVGKEVKVVEMKYLGEDNVDYHGARIPVQVMALIRDKEEILRLAIYYEEGGFCYPINVKYSDRNTIFEMKATDLQKPKGAHPSKTKLIFLSTLSFMDAITRSIKNPSETAALVNNAFIEEMKKQISESGQGILIDKEGHTITDNDENVKRLIDIALGASPLADKLEEINNKFMIPHQVDIIIVGQFLYHPQRTRFIIRPVVILKSQRQIVTRNFLLDKNKMICWKAYNRAVLCRDAPRYIKEKVTEFLSYWLGAAPQKQPALSSPSSTQPFKSTRSLRSSQPPSQPHPKTMTIEDVYRAIIKNKFYCYWNNDHYHQEIMEKLLKSGELKESQVVPLGSGTGENFRITHSLKSDWAPKDRVLKKYLIKTISTKKSGASDNIVLYWTLSKLDDRTYNYKEAKIEVRALNRQNHKGYSNWRIPDIREIFVILSDEFYPRNFFPFNSASKKLTTTLKIWTSNPVEKNESRIYGGCPGINDAYFIIDNVRKSDYRSITFDIACADEKANLLLVRSDKSPYHQTTISTTDKTPSITSTISYSPSQRIYRLDDLLTLANLHFIDFTRQSSLASTDMGELIDEAVFSGIKRTEHLTPYPYTNKTFHSVENVNQIASILFDPNLTKDERVNRIINGIMTPNHVDIIVTGLYIRSIHNSIITLRPIVIVKSRQKILSTNLEFRMHELVCDSPYQDTKTLCPEALEKIAEAVKQLLEQL